MLHEPSFDSEMGMIKVDSITELYSIGDTKQHVFGIGAFSVVRKGKQRKVKNKIGYAIKQISKKNIAKSDLLMGLLENEVKIL